AYVPSSSGMRSVRWNSIRSTASSCTSGKLNTNASSLSSTIAPSRRFALPSPVSVAHLTHETQHRTVRHVLQLADQLREQLRPPRDRLAQVARDLAGHREHHV